MPKIVESKGFHSKPGVIFDNEEQYNLFISYVRNIHVDTESGKPSLVEFFNISKDKTKKFAVNFEEKPGCASMVSKFMEVTGMMKMDFNQRMMSDYVPGQNPSELPLGRQAYATIPNQIVKEMERYKQAHPTPAPERTPNFENPRLNPKYNQEQLEPRHQQSPHHKHTTPHKHTSNKKHWHSGNNANVHNEQMVIKKTLADYETHLTHKMYNEKVIKSTNPLSLMEDLDPKQQKLLQRYQAISGINSNIKNKPLLDKNDFGSIQKVVQTCQKSRPEWSERSFLQKLTDVLTLGLTALIRSSTSKETDFVEKLKESPTTPSPGK